MKYQSVVLAVKDIKAARKFYEDLFGLKVYQDYGINIAFKEGLSLQQEFGWLVGIDDEDIKQKPNNMEICFEEEDFDGFLERLKEHVDIELINGVIEHGWGQRVIRFYDPDGHIVEVGEAIKKVIDRFLSTGMTLKQVSERMDVSEEDLGKLLSE